MALARRFLATLCVACFPLVALPHHPAMASAVDSPTPIRPHLHIHPLPSRRNPMRPGSGTPARTSPMVYHGGSVMTASINVYTIWYGNWTRRAGRQTIIRDFITNLASPYFAINSTYPDQAGRRPVDSIRVAGEYVDHYSVGHRKITDDQVDTIVSSALQNHRLPTDPDGIYLVITSKDVEKLGFLTQYCGWHSYDTIASSSIKFAFIGDPSGPDLRNCAPQTSSPNKDVAADAMVSVIAHEIDETVTDPELDGWFAAGGEENGDRCAWQFGPTYAAGKARANMHLGDRDYYVQTNWLNADHGGCVLADPHGAPGPAGFVGPTRHPAPLL